MRNECLSESLPTLQDWARLAAFVDGEGCITIKHRCSMNRGRPISTQYAVQVEISNTDARLMKWLLEVFQGRIVYGQAPKNERYRQVYRWHVHGRHAIEILTKIRPLLIIKQDQADLALEMYASITATPKHGRGQMLPEGVREYREELKVRLHQLKRETHSMSMVN